MLAASHWLERVLAVGGLDASAVVNAAIAVVVSALVAATLLRPG